MPEDLTATELIMHQKEADNILRKYRKTINTSFDNVLDAVYCLLLINIGDPRLEAMAEGYYGA